jgi:hypothetical protein
MDHDDDFKWIGNTLHGRDITFPNDTVWRLTESLAEKAQFPEEGPSEASAVFNCEQRRGSKSPCPAVIRVRMQYGCSYC